MREFVKSLNKKQLQGFLDLVNKNGKMLPAVTYAIQEHLDGNHTPYKQIIDSDPAEKHSTESVDPAVLAFTDKLNANKVRLDSENRKRLDEQSKRDYPSRGSVAR